MKFKTIRKSISFVFVILLVTAIMAPIGLASAGPLPLKIVGSNVNLRSGPGTQYPSYGLLQNGDKGFSTDDVSGWQGFRVGPDTAIYKAYGYAVSGYVASQYVVNG